jgi:hypothetical protein
MASSVQLRPYFPPARGVLAGAIVLVTAGIATNQLWRATRTAPALLLAAGAFLFTVVGALPWLFPLVNASSEPPSFLERYAFPAVLLLILIVTLGTAAFARSSLLGLASRAAAAQ